ncbi:hypothetical protein EPH_0032420 [Eimeria praecox]|uniref:Uncharacterized protein n=1 Tax=Eimeria praecox TaxID=51316 RepID=U6G2A5_9EIME|nr:hypothetical protein EPH_0032420 [Eimeria praecox]
MQPSDMAPTLIDRVTGEALGQERGDASPEEEEEEEDGAPEEEEEEEDGAPEEEQQQQHSRSSSSSSSSFCSSSRYHREGEAIATGEEEEEEPQGGQRVLALVEEGLGAGKIWGSRRSPPHMEIPYTESLIFIGVYVHLKLYDAT